jgi:hypothetical protein
MCSRGAFIDAPRKDDARSFGEISRDFVLSMIDCCPDLAEKKQRIMTALEHGHITAEEAEDWISVCGLEAA